VDVLEKEKACFPFIILLRKSRYRASGRRSKIGSIIKLTVIITGEAKR
jgi:hypothetical protein